jgi:hypothetical protein
VVTGGIRAIQAMVGIRDILVTATRVIPFITAILVTMVTLATMETWDIRVILVTEVCGIQDMMVWDIMDTMSIMNMEIWAIIMVGNGDRFARKRSSNMADLIVVLLDLYY